MPGAPSQLPLFSLPESSQDSAVNVALRPVRIVHAKYTGAEHETWQQLFDGFDEMYAITFSSGIDFVSQVLKRFRKAEVGTNKKRDPFLMKIYYFLRLGRSYVVCCNE